MISVIMICRNQSWNIARLIESVLQETASFPNTQITLLDSLSTDSTLEIARRYPIDILRFLPNARLTTNIGRYVGYTVSRGEFLLFLDGDMQLSRGWVQQALAVFSAQPQVAVITGATIDVPVNSDTVVEDESLLPTDPAQIPLPFIGGAGMYRRAVLEKIGPFNPWLISDGEPELCIRIRQKGYQVMMLDRPMVYHFSDPTDKISTMIGRWRRRLYMGFGQNLRNKLGTEYFWPYFWERGYGCAPLLVLALGAATLATSLVTRQAGWFLAWLALVILVLITDALRKKSLYRMVYSLVQRTLVTAGTVRGFFITPQRPEDFPMQYEVIQQASPTADKDS